MHTRNTETACRALGCARSIARLGVHPMHRFWRVVSLVTMAALIPLMGMGCPPVIYVPGPVLYVVSMNRNRALNGDHIHIQWEFQNELDQNGNSKIESQSVQFIASSIIRLDLEPEERPLDICTRGIDFEFRDPVTVTLKAALVGGGHVSASVDVLWQENEFARGRVLTQDPKYPRLGALVEQEIGSPPVPVTLRSIIFSEFIAIHDKDDDGVIDQLATSTELRDLLRPNEDFRAHSLHLDRRTAEPVEGTAFPAFEIVNRNTNEGFFRHSHGVRFPSVPEDQRAALGRNRCNAVIFAGAFICGGIRSDPPKLDNGGDAPPVIQAAVDFDPVFVMLDAVDDGRRFTVTDIHLGNLKQGLVCSWRRGLDDGRDQDRRHVGSGGVSELVRPNDVDNHVGLIRGQIKNAWIAETVVTRDDVTITSEIGGERVRGAYVVFDFDYLMPYVEDDNIIPAGTSFGSDLPGEILESAGPNCS